MMSLLRRLWRWLRGPERGVRPEIALRLVDDDPEIYERGVLYVVGAEGFPWKAALRCPCGCDSLIELNMAPPHRPMWRLTRSGDDRPTLHPSVWRTVGCRSHFWIREGRIVWCAENHTDHAGDLYA